MTGLCPSVLESKGTAMQPNAPFTPRPNLTAEEKTRLARRLRRRANLTDVCILLTAALAVAAGWLDSAAVSVLFLCAAAAAVILSARTYYRCPCCGNRTIRGSLGEDRNLVPFVWRMYECPVCGFSPDWSR